MPVPDPSPRGAINLADVKSLLITALIFGASAVLTFVIEHIASVKLDEFIPGAEAFMVLILGMLLKFVQKFLNGPVVVVMLLGLFLLAPSNGIAEEVVIDAGSRPGTYFLKVVVHADGTASVHSVTKVVTLDGPTPNPTPTPVPTPPQPTVLTERAKAVKAAAEKVAGDSDRATTAKGLAALYREVAKAARLGKVPDGTAFSTMLRMSTDMLLAARGDKAPAAWQPVRDVVSSQWTDAAAKGASVGDLAGLLEEAASGLEASSPAKEINPQMIALIMQIIKIVLELLAK